MVYWRVPLKRREMDDNSYEIKKSSHELTFLKYSIYPEKKPNFRNITILVFLYPNIELINEPSLFCKRFELDLSNFEIVCLVKLIGFSSKIILKKLEISYHSKLHSLAHNCAYCPSKEVPTRSGFPMVKGTFHTKFSWYFVRKENQVRSWRN